MAIYTMELRDVVKLRNIFDFEYPFFDEKKRAEFEKSFIRHFYFREICHPSLDRFKIYLEDKFMTVFPYYNELMRTATIEYDIENPYNLTETYTRNVDSMGKANTGAYSVGSTTQSEKGETSTSSEAHKKENQTGTARDVQQDTGSSETVRTENVDSENTKVGNVTENGQRTATENGSGNKMHEKRFLDTPQGKVTLSDPSYITNLEWENDTNSETKESEESSNAVKNESETVKGSTDTEGNSRTTEDKNTTINRDSENVLNGSETQQGSATAQTDSEQHTTQDTSSRSENIGKQTETYTMTRKGNIGVNPASHEVNHHILTQKTLKRIEEMFFNECEDLFMMVY